MGRRGATLGSGILLIVSFALAFAGIVMFAGTNVFDWFIQTSRYFAWERSLFIAGYVASALGVALVDVALGGKVTGRLAATAFLLAAVIAVIVEASFLSARPMEALLVVMVVLLFLAEAAVGVAMIGSALVPDWAAWTLVIVNVLAPVGLLVFSGDDLYYPILHYGPLLLLGVCLVRGQNDKARIQS